MMRDIEKEVVELRKNQEFIIRALKNLNEADEDIIKSIVPLIMDFKKRSDSEVSVGYV